LAVGKGLAASFGNSMKVLLIVLPIIGVVSWWLSGFDPKVTGQDRNADFSRRFIRCGITLFLVAMGASFALVWIAMSIILAIIWMGCASEMFSRGFHKLVDSEDNREFDPAQVSRDLDQLAGLVKLGQSEQAIALCKRMRESSDGSALAIEAQLFQLYSDVFAGRALPVSPPLVEANGLCAQNRFLEAQYKLEPLLKREPDNSIAALMLVRLYGRDLKRSEDAEALLKKIELQSQVPAPFIKHARELLAEWSGAAPAKAKSDQGIESLLIDSKHAPPPQAAPSSRKPVSVDELLATGHLATAIEILDRQVREHPGNFESLLKLAEAHARYCNDVSRACKILAKIEGNSSFNPEQVKLAKAKLKEWRSGV